MIFSGYLKCTDVYPVACRLYLSLGQRNLYGGL